MRTVAILPVKHFARAKQRLSASVADPLRLELAGAMVGDVLATLTETAAIERTIVVTGEPSVARAARAQGAIVIDDTTLRGQSAAVTLGIERALAEGMERALCVPGDCPTLDPTELQEMLCAPREGPSENRARMPDPATPHAASDEPEVVIVPDRHGTGTNGLLLAPPDAIRPSFGPGSCERHRALALAAGVLCHIKRPASLLLDIDTGEDLTVLHERLAGEHIRAPRTRAVLDHLTRADQPIITTPA